MQISPKPLSMSLLGVYLCRISLIATLVVQLEFVCLMMSSEENKSPFMNSAYGFSLYQSTIPEITTKENRNLNVYLLWMDHFISPINLHCYLQINLTKCSEKN